MSTNLQMKRRMGIDVAIRDGTRRRARELRLGTAGEYDPAPLPNCASLAATHNTSEKTIQRDLDWLRDEQNAPLEYDRQRHGFYYSEETYALPAISITESDLFSICIAEKALEQYANTPLQKKLAAVFDKITESLPDKVTIHPAWVSDRVSFFAAPARRLDAAIWEKVVKALRDGRRLSILYQSPGRPTPTARRVDPYHMVSYRGDWYLMGYCHSREEVRQFAVSRIRKVEMLDSRFDLPSGFNPQKVFEKRFGIMVSDKTYGVSIWFSPRAAPCVEEREWQRGQQLKRNKDGSVVLTLQASHLDEVAAWILSWGKEAKVLKPAELAKRIRQEHQQAAGMYS